MKKIFIYSRRKLDISEKQMEEISKNLPEKISIAYSIQYKGVAIKFKDYLSKTKNIGAIIQVLGCSSPKFPENTEAVLIVGSGKFHAVSLASEINGKKIPVYLFEENHLKKISETEIDEIKKKKKASYINFLNSNSVGVISSLKPGQEKLKRSLDFKKSLLKKYRKKAYLFLCDNINTNEFENFSIDSWVNTACPRMDLESSKIINLSAIESY